MKDTLGLRILNREKILIDTRVSALSAVNKGGLFDILPGHTNFISVIIDKIMIRTIQGKSNQVSITRGVMRVLDNKVDIYFE